MTAPTDPAGVAAIAAGKLTEREREALLARRGSVAVCRSLKRKELADRVEGTGMAWLAYPVLTAEGWATRAHLAASLSPVSKEDGS